MVPMSLADFEAALPDIEVPDDRTYERNEFTIESEFPPSSGDLIADKCPQLALMRESKGNIEEPLWYCGIGVLTHAVEGDELIHDWSSGHPDYHAGETAGKIKQWRNQGYGPTTCAKFASLNPEACSGCPFKDKITSPIQLGTTVTEIQDAPSDNTGDSYYDNKPTTIGRWTIGREGVLMESEDGQPELIIEEPIFIDRIGRLGYGDAIANVSWLSLSGTWHKSEMSLTVLGEDKAMRTWLYSHAITSFRKVSDVRNYLKDYTMHLNREGEPDLICQRFGWDGQQHFMLGPVRIGEAETKQVRLDAGLPKEMKDHLKPKGDIQAWTDATEVFQDTDHWKHAFALLASLAAPVFKLADITGAVASFAGESGSGKTTSTSFGLSVWGDPKALTASAQGTLNSKGELLRAANNLPLLVDDVSSYNRMLSALVYMAANGKAKERVSRSGKLYGQEEWQTVMFVTTNSPLLDLPEGILGEAERRRVLELDMDTPMSDGAAIKLNEVMKDHSGVAGPIFIQALIQERSRVVEQFSDNYKAWLADPEIPEANRFGVWLIAAASVAGNLASEIGLIKFDVEPIIEKALGRIKATAKDIRKPAEIVEEMVLAFINKNINSISVIEKKSWVKVAEREAVAKIDRSGKSIAIPIHTLKSLAVESSIPGSYLNKWLDTHAVEKKKCLMTSGGAREYCHIIKLGDNLPNIMEDNDAEDI
jgi:hypothetical protein